MALRTTRHDDTAPWGEYIAGIGPLTVEEFERLPTEDGWVFELREGRLIRMPGPGGIHGLLQVRFTGMLLKAMTDQQAAGLIGTACYYFPHPNGDDVLCPDLSYITPERVPTITYRGSYLATMPDLVIEIASPNDFRPQMQAKAQFYLTAGVRLVWIAWPSRNEIDVWQPTNRTMPSIILTITDTLSGLDILPDFSAPLKDIFNC